MARNTVDEQRAGQSGAPCAIPSPGSSSTPYNRDVRCPSKPSPFRLTFVEAGPILLEYSAGHPSLRGAVPMKNLEPEDVWLRFFLRRLRLGLRRAKSAEVAAVLKELISDAEEQLDRLERGT